MGVQTREKKLDKRTVAFIEAVKAADHTSSDTAATTEQIAVIRNGAVHATRRLLLLNASRGFFVHLPAKPGEHHKWYVNTDSEVRTKAAEKAPPMPRDHRKRAYKKDTPGVKTGPWSYEDVKLLKSMWGEEHIATMSWKLQRTVEAIRYMGYTRLRLASREDGPRHGLKGLDTIERETGYHKTRLQIAAENLGIEGKVFPRMSNAHIDPNHPRAYKGFDEDQVQQILDYLSTIPDAKPIVRKSAKVQRRGEWGCGLKPPCCVHCKRTSIPHVGRGLCNSCYTIWIRAGKPEDLSLLHPIKIRIPEAAE